MTKNKIPKESTKLAGKEFDVSDYGKQDEFYSGLAITHEQVSDTYTEGEIASSIEKENRQTDPIPKKRF